MVMGVCIAGPKDSWIRFAVLEVPWDAIPKYVMDDYWAWLDRDEREIDLDTPLALDWS
jgi:predicted nucleotidyltransferase